MSTFTYMLKLHNTSKVLSIPIEFTPYTNLVSGWSSTITGWSSANSSVKVIVDPVKNLLKSQCLNFTLAVQDEGTIKKSFSGTPNTNYMIACYIRNDGVLSSALRVGDKVDFSSNYFTNRLVVAVNSGSTGIIDINLDLYVRTTLQANAWVGGFFITEISDSDLLLDRDTLSLKYPHVGTSKSSPSARDLISSKYAGSPFQYFLTHRGVRIADYSKPLSELGVTSSDVLETYINELPVQLFYTFIDSVALMSMLDGDISKVSHTFPKMPSAVNEPIKTFPRVQYFMGHEVSSSRADGKSLANTVNVGINIYVPITMVTNSMQDSMIAEVVRLLMSDLGFSAIRGSDYFREPEQLYVRQTQYIKDIQIYEKVKT